MEKKFKFTCTSCGAEVETDDEHGPATCLNCIDKELEGTDLSTA